MREGLPRWWHAAACALLAFPAANALGVTRVVVERLADGAARVDYLLEDETTELAFAREAPPNVGRQAPSARAKWTVLSDGLALRDNRVVSTNGSPFSAASIRIETTDKLRDGRTALVTIGARSSVMDLALVLPQVPVGTIALELRNAFDVQARECVDKLDIDDGGNWLGSAPLLYVVVSASRESCDEATQGEPTLVAEDAPAELRLVVAQELAGANRRLAEKLRRPLDPAPTVVLAYARQGAGISFGTGVDSVVLARLEGEGWSAPTAYQTSMLAFSLTQALVPSWLDGVVAPSAGPVRARPWLVGAPAQYLATLDRQGLGEKLQDPGRLLADIDLCSRRVGDPAPGSPAPAPVDRDAHSCGLLIQFVYDAITRAETAGRRTLFDVWADVLEQADGGPIDTEAFLATNERARAVVEGLVYGPAADFEGIAMALRDAGIDASIGDPRDIGGAVASLLRVLVNADCDQGLGGAGPFVGDRVGIKTRGSCRTLPSEVELISIAGVGILTSARDVYEATAKACTERGRVMLTGALASQEFEIACPASVPPLPQQLLIRNVHFLN